MKVALIDPSLFTWPYDHALAQGLSQIGHDVFIFGKYLAADEGGSVLSGLQEIFYPGLERPWAEKMPRSVFLALKGISHPFSLLRLLHRLRDFRPDVIHFQWVPLPVVDQYFISSFRWIAPVILTIHDSNPFNNNPGSRLQRLGAISIMDKFDRLIVHTDQARQRLKNHGIADAKIALIPHGILDQSQNDFAVTPVAEPRENGRVNILLFGKLKPYKGADILLRAVAAMPPLSRARCHVRIVGKAYMDVAPLKAMAKQLGIENNVTWDLRFIEDAEMPGLFAQSDIIAMPYREIDASGVLMAALSSGRPIVASRIGLFAEMLREGKHGYLVAIEDIRALADALTRLVNDGDLRHEMGQNVLDLKAAIPNWREIAQMTEALYLSACKK